MDYNQYQSYPQPMGYHQSYPYQYTGTANHLKVRTKNKESWLSFFLPLLLWLWLRLWLRLPWGGVR